MRTRRWILFIALLFTFSVLVIYHGWNLLKINERTKIYILSKIRPALGENCHIEKLEMTLGAVHLKNVKLNLADSSYSLVVENIRAGINLISLIKNGFRPQRILHDILFIQPHLTIRHVRHPETNPEVADSSSMELSPDQYWQKAQKFNFIQRITVSRGKTSYIDSTGRTTLLAHDMNGWLSLKDIEKTSARLVGKIFRSADYNLIMTGDLDLVRARLNLLNIKLNNYEWKDKIPFLIPDYFDIEQGTINGTISIAEKKFEQRKFDIWGDVSVSDGAFQISQKKLFFTDINLNAHIKDWNCVFDSSGFLFNGSPVAIAGTIKNVLNPRLELVMRSDFFDINKALQQITQNSKIKIKGASTVLFRATNSFINPTIEGTVNCPQLTLNSRAFHDLKTKITFKDSIFQMTHFSSQLENLTVQSHGRIDFSKDQNNVFFSLTSSGAISDGLLGFRLPSLNGSDGALQIQGTGNFSQITGNVDLQVKTAFDTTMTFKFKGGFSLIDSQLSLFIRSPSPLLNLEGVAQFSGGEPKYLIKLNDIHNLVYAFPETKFLQTLFNCDKTFFQIEGQAENWEINGDVNWLGEAGELYRAAKLNGKIKTKGDNTLYDANIKILSGGKQFYSNIHLIRTPESLKIKNIDLESLLYCNGRIEFQGDQAIDANIIFPEAPFADFVSLIFSRAQSINQGKLFGFISLSGTLQNPRLSGKINLLDLIMNHIGLYDVALMFQLLDRQLVFNEFNIKHNQEPIFNCSGGYQVDSGQVNFDLKTKEVDLNSLVTTLLNKPDILKGKGSSELKIIGNARFPQLSGKIELQNGKLGRFAFDRILCDVGKNQISDSSGKALPADTSADEGLTLSRILITRSGEFEMQGNGVIPYSPDKSMDITLSGRGNVLAILPEITSFFKETNSDGKWIANFSGRPNNLSVSSGKLALTNGYLRLGDVAPEIKNIAVDMELEQDGFLNVKFISGKIKGKPFTFRNVRSVSNIAKRNLEPFQIPELGLDFGIWTIETSSKGVALRIPGLMEKGEVGQFVFSGKIESEPFLIAGPVERPVVRGKIQLHNVNFTFPFIVSNTSDTTTSPVVQVLQMIDWDVKAFAGKDMHYQRQVPSGMDNVYLDLIVDTDVGDLQFSGVIDENTFGVVGNLESSRGTVEYLDLDFQVTKAGVEFDMGASRSSDVEFDKTTLLPIIYGEARTTVTDSTGFPYYIYLTLFTVDKTTGHKLKRGRLGDVVFELTSDNPNLGDTEGELLASLGYSPSNISQMATNLIGISADNLIFRPLFRPFERQLERTLGLDMVRFSSRFTRNLIEMNLRDERNFEMNSKLFLLRSTKLMIGKYLANRLLFIYTGQLEAGMDYRYQHEGVGFRHILGLEYRINPTLLLQMEYDYNSLLLWQKEDKKIMLRHSFPF